MDNDRPLMLLYTIFHQTDKPAKLPNPSGLYPNDLIDKRLFNRKLYFTRRNLINEQT